MGFIYPAGDEQETPNLGLATWGMDEVTAQNFIILDAAFGTIGGIPGGVSGNIQGNNAGAFGGLPGSTLDFTNGLIALAPTGTGVALSITGDAFGSDIQDWYSNGFPSPPVVSIDTFGDVIIAPVSPNQNVALSVFGNASSGGIHPVRPDVVDFYVNGQTSPNWGIAIQQNGDTIGLNLLIKDADGDRTYIDASTYRLNAIGIGTVSIADGEVQFIGYSLTISSNNGTYGQAVALSVFGDNLGDDITDFYPYGTTTPAVAVSGTGSLVINNTLTDGTASVGTLGQVLSSTVTGVKWVTSSSGSASSLTLSPINLLSGSTDAINPHTAATYMVTSAGADAMTLAAPTVTTDDGKVIKVTLNTNAAHTITCTGGTLRCGTAAAVTMVNFASFHGSSIELMAWQGNWYVMAQNNIASFS